MKVKVYTSIADYEAFFAHIAQNVLKSYAWIPVLKNAFLWVALFFCFLLFFRFKSGEVGSKLFLSVLTVSVSFFAYAALGKLLDVKAVKCFSPNENGIMIGSKEFEISAEGIKEVHPYGYNFYNWSAVEKIEEVNGSVYVFVDAVLALIFNPESLGPDEKK